MNSPTLLIVDDEKTTRDGLRLALEDRYDVFVADDAAAAMELLERERFDVLLTDLRLPKEDGLKLIDRAKSLPRPPICILMTAYGSDETIVEAMKRGADDYIAKGRMEIELLELKIDKALMFGALHVNPGTYTLYTLPADGKWQLIVSKKTGQWGVPYPKGEDVGRAPMIAGAAPAAVEQLTISVEDTKTGGTLHIDWGPTRLSAPFSVM